MTPDFINGCFECVGAYFVWRNAWQLRKDREVKGVYWPTTVFFTVWGLWNLVFYSALEQWWSWAAGIVLMLGNVAWVVQLAIYMKTKKISANMLSVR